MRFQTLLPAQSKGAFHPPATTAAATSDLARITQQLLLDPWMVVTLLMTAAFVAVPYSQFLATDIRFVITEYLSTVVLLAVAIGAVLQGVPGLNSQRERYFWRLFGLSLSAWLAGDLLASLFLYSDTPTEGSGVDALYLFLYLSLMLALDMQPQAAGNTIRIRPLRVLASVGRTLLLCGVFIYFVLLPRTLGVDEYLTWMPSFFFYVTLDFFVVARLLRVAWQAPSSRWRWIYSLLAVAMGFLLLTDAMDLAWMAGALPEILPTSIDILWFLPMVLIVASSRLRHLIPTADGRLAPDVGTDNIKGVPLLVISSGFVLIHLFLSVLQLNEGPVRNAQVILVMVCVVIFGVLNLVQNSIVERKSLHQRLRRKEAEAHILSLSLQDPLTGLLNRRAFDAEFSRAVARASRSGLSLGLMFIDLDHFKTINDTYGHSAGDGVLREAAARIKAFTRDIDTLARYGGDEFVLVLEGLETQSDAAIVAGRILDGFRMGFQFESGRIEMSASIGLAIYPGHGRTPMQLFEAADRAMYRVKETGGSGIEIA